MAVTEGPSLAQLLGHRGTLPPRLAVDIATRAARALATAHRDGRAHGALTPEMIQLTRDGQVVVRSGDLPAPNPDSFAARPYLAPEVLRGEPPTPAADVFSLGVVLHTMLTGAPARPGRVEAGLPAGIGAILERAVSLDPARRFATAPAFAQSLDVWSTRHPTRGGPVEPPTALAGPHRPLAPSLPVAESTAVVEATTFIQRTGLRPRRASGSRGPTRVRLRPAPPPSATSLPASPGHLRSAAPPRGAAHAEGDDRRVARHRNRRAIIAALGLALLALLVPLLVLGVSGGRSGLGDIPLDPLPVDAGGFGVTSASPSVALGD